jgi:DNA-binding GntR family transcriptional regulator
MRLSEKAYHLIKGKIVTLELKPLTVIDEQALRDDLGLGRTPIREALHRLAAEGLVIIAPRRGMFVAEIGITDLQKIFEARQVMEGFCARLAAQRVTPAQIDQMEAALEELRQVSEGDSEAMLRVDKRLHGLLYEAANNEFLAESLSRLYTLSSRLWHLALDQIVDVKDAVRSHQGIVDALKKGDPDLAEALAREHTALGQRELRALL